LIDSNHLLVLGAGPGLGASIARRFGREGFTVTLVARRERALAELAGQLAGEAISVDTASADAADPHAFRTAMERLARRLAPGVVVYNAALITRDNILDIDEDDVLRTYAINVLGAITAAQVFTPAMREARAGTFLATGGPGGLDPQPTYASLSLGKAGLRAAVSLLHTQLKDDGVHATSVRIAGAIAPNTPLAPALIADAYWALHTQPAADWTDEAVFDGQHPATA
jgi:short-subunit dehydrogenase